MLRMLLLILVHGSSTRVACTSNRAFHHMHAACILDIIFILSLLYVDLSKALWKMATSAGDSSIIQKEFPSEFENVFNPRRQSPKQAAEKVLTAGNDHRQRILKVDTPAPGFLYDGGSGFPFIGLLRVEFNKNYFMGTATMIAHGSTVLTCAHNVVGYDPTTKEFMDPIYPTSAWFELRENKPRRGSVMIKRYQVTSIDVYPPYFKDPSSSSGFDLALCWIDVPDDDCIVKELYSKYRGNTPNPLSGFYISSKAAVVGFPGEHSGEKWGMAADVPRSKAQDWKFGPNPFDDDSDEEQKENEPDILTYDFIDTSPGQSGSPVMGMKPADIIGVHTGGSDFQKKNWATHITPKKLQWIAGELGHQWIVDSDYGTSFLRKCTCNTSSGRRRRYARFSHSQGDFIPF